MSARYLFILRNSKELGDVLSFNSISVIFFLLTSSSVLPEMCSLFQGGYISVNLCYVTTTSKLSGLKQLPLYYSLFWGQQFELGMSWVVLGFASTWCHSSAGVTWIIQNGLTRMSSYCFWPSAGPRSACSSILKEARSSFFTVISNIPRRQGPLHCHSSSLYMNHIFCDSAGQKASHKAKSRVSERGDYASIDIGIYDSRWVPLI